MMASDTYVRKKIRNWEKLRDESVKLSFIKKLNEKYILMEK